MQSSSQSEVRVFLDQPLLTLSLRRKYWRASKIHLSIGFHNKSHDNSLCSEEKSIGEDIEYRSGSSFDAPLMIS